MIQSRPAAARAGQEQPDLRQPCAQRLEVTNISRRERWISGIGGSALSAYGLWKHGEWGMALALLGGSFVLRGISGHSALYQVLRISTAKGEPQEQTLKVERTVTVNLPPQELYRRWRDVERLPEVIPGLKEVQARSPIQSRWTLEKRGPFAISWEAEIMSEEPGEYFTWQTLPGSAVCHQGSVQFASAPGGHGTEVKVILEYMLPGGKLAHRLASLCGLAPDQQVREALRHFKAMMETGEIPTTQKQPHGASSARAPWQALLA